MDPQMTPPVVPQQPLSTPQPPLPQLPQAPQVQAQPASQSSDATPEQVLTPAPQYNDTSQVPVAPQEVAAIDNDVIIQQIATAINGGKNVLVTVSIDPSVDELASAVGITFLLGKLGKHATAVFSGKIPPALEFLEPEAVFEDTVDSLRDFIIALDKEKADKLRYKVEEDVVKIFITPYKTILSEKDLEYSQGDFNVDIVLALGVTKREELDKAITSHGRILHDATVVTVNAGGQSTGLGAIDWHDTEASSVAEMLVLLADALGKDKFDSQISTAFLTGLVAQTNRFSNEKTSPKVMTTAAQLMASGANQQLIATNLRHEGMISEPVRKKEDTQPHDDDGEMVLHHDDAKKNSPDKSAKQGAKKSYSNKETVGAASQSDALTPPASYKAAPSAVEVEKEDKNSSVNTASKDSKKSSDPHSETTVSGQNSSVAAAKSTEKSASESLRETLQQSDNSAPTTQEEHVEDKQESAQVLDIVNPDEVSAQEAPLTLPPPVQRTPDVTRPHKVIEPLSSSEATTPSPSTTPPAIMQQPHKEEMQKPSFGGTLNATTAQAEADTAAQKIRESSVNNEALSHDAQAKSEADLLSEARMAVEDAEDAAAFNPAHHPTTSLNAQPLDPISPEPALQINPATKKEPSPVDEFMQPHQNQAPIVVAPGPGAEPQFSMTPPLSGAPVVTPSQNMQPAAPVAAPMFGAPQSMAPSLPPLPPMPGGQGGGSMPPMPPMPGQVGDAATNTQPQVTPAFISSVPQTQNTWTAAGDEMAQKYADRDAKRQERADEIKTTYSDAADRNKQLQQQNPAE